MIANYAANLVVSTSDVVREGVARVVREGASDDFEVYLPYFSSMRTRIAFLLIVPLVTPLGLVANSAAATSAGETCQGVPATIVSDGESVTGTPGPDVIVLNAVNQPNAGLTVRSGGGNDLVCLTGQNSQIEVDLGDGDDSLVVDDTPTARPITVKVDLGVGSDTVVTGRGFDSVTSGDRTSAAPDGPDEVSTGDGDGDRLYQRTEAP